MNRRSDRSSSSCPAIVVCERASRNTLTLADNLCLYILRFRYPLDSLSRDPDKNQSFMARQQQLI